MSHKNTFDKRAQNYQSGRPGYAPEAVKFLLEELLPAGGTVADIGAGTGIFTKECLAYGAETFAVEPNRDMLSVLRQNFLQTPQLHILEATAEHTTLPDHSIDLITCASSFHWLDAGVFRKECLRILKPGGYVAVFINARDYNDPFTQRQHALCMRYCSGFTSLCHGLNKIRAAMPGFFGDELQCRNFDFPLHYTRQKFIDRSLSSSYAPDPGTEAYGQYTRALEQLLEESCSGDLLIAPNVTALYWGRL